MGNTEPKKLPTLRDPEKPEQMAVYMREVRELFRNLETRIKELEARIRALE